MPRSGRFSSSASPSARAVWTGTTNSAKTKLLRRLFQKTPRRSGSIRIRRYCSSPTHFGSRAASRRTLCSDSQKAMTNGKMTKATSRNMAGATMSRAVRVSLGGFSGGGSTADFGSTTVADIVHSSLRMQVVPGLSSLRMEVVPGRRPVGRRPGVCYW